MVKWIITAEYILNDGIMHIAEFAEDEKEISKRINDLKLNPMITNPRLFQVNEIGLYD